MRMRHSAEFIGRRLLARSAVNEMTLLVNGCHCRDVIRGLKEDRAGHDYGRLWAGDRLEYMHRLSHEVWVGPIPEGLDVLHRCDRPRCIEPRHLKSGTAAENSGDMVAKGRHLAGAAIRGQKSKGRPSHMRGEASPRAKLTKDEARAIKGMKNNRNVRGTDVAEKYGISESAVRAIWRGDLWGWLGVEPNQDTERVSPIRIPKQTRPATPKKYAINDPIRPTVKKLSLRAVLKGIAA